MKTFIPEAVFSALVAGALLLPVTMPNSARAANPPTYSVQFVTIQIDGLNIVYREAGDPKKPTLLLLHSFRMLAADPERVYGFIIQHGNAYEEGLRKFWDPIKA